MGLRVKALEPERDQRYRKVDEEIQIFHKDIGKHDIGVVKRKVLSGLFSIFAIL